MFKAILLTETDGKVVAKISELDEAQLPQHERAVRVAVTHSTLNYKDGMILNGLGRLVRRYPHVPGVDFAGRVEESAHPDFKPGDQVILTGWRVGEAHWGGYGEKAQVAGDWLVHLPAGLTTRQAMAVGTAGFTAMLAIMALEEHGITPESGEVLVTGAAGGVGSLAVMLLAKLGYRVAASTGRVETHDYLKDLGAAEIIAREDIATPSGRPLEKERCDRLTNLVESGRTRLPTRAEVEEMLGDLAQRPGVGELIDDYIHYVETKTYRRPEAGHE